MKDSQTQSTYNILPSVILLLLLGQSPGTLLFPPYMVYFPQVALRIHIIEIETRFVPLRRVKDRASFKDTVTILFHF